MSRRTLRHPFRGNSFFGKPRPSRRRRPSPPKRRQPRIRPRKSVNVAALVAAPEEQAGRPAVRLRIVGVAVALLFAVMVLRLWSLQIIDAKQYTAAVNRNQIRVVSVPAPRGLIVDRNGTVLVGNAPHQQILLSHSEALQHPEVVGDVAALVGQTPAQVWSTLSDPQYNPYEPVPVDTSATPATVQFLEEHQSEFPGVSTDTVAQRTYPQGGTVATHALGYVGDITAQQLAAHPNLGYTQQSQYGQSGLEEEYQQYLRGKDGNDQLAVNHLGQVVGTVSKTAPVQGDTLVLNLDYGLQNFLQQALANQIQTDRQTPDAADNNALPPAKDGAVIALDPQNGQVLALASYPSYDLNEWLGGISQAAYTQLQDSGAENDNAIDGLFTPGSTFKLVTATAALQTGLITPDFSIDDATGTYTVPGCTGSSCTLHDDDSDAEGETDLVKAIAVSDDVYFYNLGAMFWDARGQYGTQPIQNVAAQYGEGDITGIDLPGEGQGRVDSPTVVQKLHAEDPAAYPYDTWYTGSNVEMAFGQGGTVLTPIEQAVTYATFANGGTRYAPQLASSVVDPITGKTVVQFAPKVTGHVTISPTNWQAILTGLEGVVQYGTAAGDFQGFPLQQFPLAGKTGTASSNGQEPDSWFVAFGPAGSPTSAQYLILCVIGQGGYGASAAAPVVRQGFDYLLANPIGPVKPPTGTHQPSLTPPPTAPPAAEPTTTTTTTTPG